MLVPPFDELAHWYDAIYASRGKDFAAEADEILDAVDEGRATPPRSLLDVACGTGAHLLQFGRRIGRIEGIDIHPAMVDAARRQARRATISCGDMTAIPLGPPVDLITCLFASIGYLPDRASVRRALRSWARRTSPGGSVAIEPPRSPGDLAAPRRQTDRVRVGDATIVREVDAGRRGDRLRVAFELRIEQAGSVRTRREIHSVRLIDLSELETDLRECGWTGIESRRDALGGRGLIIARRSDATLPSRPQSEPSESDEAGSSRRDSRL